MKEHQRAWVMGEKVMERCSAKAISFAKWGGSTNDCLTLLHAKWQYD